MPTLRKTQFLHSWQIRRYSIFTTGDDGAPKNTYLGCAIKQLDGTWYGCTYDGYYKGDFSLRREVVELLVNRAKVHGLIKEKKDG